MTDLVALRRLTPADAAAFRALRLDALAREPSAFGAALEEEADKPLSFFEARLSGGIMLGGWRDGRLVATGGLAVGTRARTRHRARLWGFYVAPEVRGTGLGRRLAEALIAEATRLPGVDAVTLSATGGNAAALACYRAAGFTITGVDPGALRVDGVDYDEVLMHRRLR